MKRLLCLFLCLLPPLSSLAETLPDPAASFFSYGFFARYSSITACMSFH